VLGDQIKTYRRLSVPIFEKLQLLLYVFVQFEITKIDLHEKSWWNIRVLRCGWCRCCRCCYSSVVSCVVFKPVC